MPRRLASSAMKAFDNLLPVLQPRVVEFAEAPPFGHTARLDNQLYLQVCRIASYFIWNNVIQLRFLAFPSAGGSFLTPLIPAVSRVSCVWWGFQISPRGGILDTRGGRADPRRVQKSLHSNAATMVVCEAKPSAKYLVTTWESHPLEPDDPRRWAKATFMVLPKGFNGERGYDWPALGQKILQNSDDIRRTLATACAR